MAKTKITNKAMFSSITEAATDPCCINDVVGFAADDQVGVRVDDILTVTKTREGSPIDDFYDDGDRLLDSMFDDLEAMPGVRIPGMTISIEYSTPVLSVYQLTVNDD